MNKKIKKATRALIFPGVFTFMELMFHLYYFKSIGLSLLYMTLFAISYGLMVTAITSFPVKKANRIITWVVMVITGIFFGLQTVYGHIFKTFISLHSVMENAGDASEFWKEALKGIVECLPGFILVMVIPFCAVGFALKKEKIGVWGKNFKENTIYQVACLLAGIVFTVFGLLSLSLGGKEAFTAYDIYHNDFMLDAGIENLGVITATRKDFHQLLFGDSEEITIVDTDNLSSMVIPTVNKQDKGDDVLIPVTDIPPVPTAAPAVSTVPENPDEITPVATATPTPSPSPTPTPIDTSPNVLDIDFAALAEECKNSDIKTIHEYMASSEPTKKNEYTGMFEGYNLIYMVCEGFSPWAVDKDVTPTLYRLTHEGFVFNNFYNPIWYTSTSDGEYVACQGLLPYSSNSFKRSKKNSIPFCLGWQFLKLGYTSRAWHAHTATYYGRNETHPNMGYIFKAKNAGLKIKDVWPESDLEMIQNSLPEYINDEHFHVYYMTVSGHLEYTFSGNSMASKNKSYVENLPYSNNCKAYIACNKELDLALEYLIDELEKAGIADKTVIAFTGDHYPYGLTIDEISELNGSPVEEEFELYHSNFVLWSESIKEPIVIDKYCSSLDMLPTVSNLFGLEYDSRLLMGSDILSDAPALVMFADKSFITDYCKYNVNNREVTMLQDVELPENYISNVSSIVKNKFNISKSILLNDYYSYLMDFIPGVVTKVPESYDDY